MLRPKRTAEGSVPKGAVARIARRRTSLGAALTRFSRGVLWSLLGCLLGLVLAAGGFVVIALPFLLPDSLYWVIHGWRYPAVSQVGDATLSDDGPRSAVDRYVIDFGPIDLSAPNVRTYTVRQLPEISFTLGLELWTAASDDAFRDVLERAVRGEDVRGGDFMKVPEAIKTAAPVDTVVGIRLVAEDDRLVIEEHVPLADWVWSGSRRAFAYRRGRSEWVSLARGGSTSRAIGVRTDEGWDTYFTPRKRGGYHVTLTVAPRVRPSDGLSARLIATGGGWK